MRPRARPGHAQFASFAPSPWPSLLQGRRYTNRRNDKSPPHTGTIACCTSFPNAPRLTSFHAPLLKHFFSPKQYDRSRYTKREALLVVSFRRTLYHEQAGVRLIIRLERNNAREPPRVRHLSLTLAIEHPNTRSLHGVFGRQGIPFRNNNRKPHRRPPLLLGG